MTSNMIKMCQTCGRQITWRKKWERNWDSIKYCSDTCRTHKPSQVDLKIESNILSMLRQRQQLKSQGRFDELLAMMPPKTKRGEVFITAEDVEEPSDPDHRERARRAARRLANGGKIVIMQDGRPVSDPSFVKGIMQLRSSYSLYCGFCLRITHCHFILRASLDELDDFSSEHSAGFVWATDHFSTDAEMNKLLVLFVLLSVGA
ncbi:hypothetical protein PROFUN_06874, partial [Planoprotostelium fungivorum]